MKTIILVLEGLNCHSLVVRASCLIFILSLQVKERPDVGVYVKDLSSYVMNNADDLDKTMTVGNKNRESLFISNRCYTNEFAIVCNLI